MNNPSPALASLLNMSTIMTPPNQMQAADNVPSSGDTTALMPSYALGGMVGPGGEPVRPNLPGLPGLSGPSNGGMGAQQMELEARRFVQQNPQQVAEIRTAIEEALADGDITMDQVKVLTNMAKVALQNPEMYPQLKQAVMSQGILSDDELPPEFDQGTMFILLLIGQIMQSSPTQPGMQPAAPGMENDDMEEEDDMEDMPSMASGGALPPKSPSPDGSIPIKAHEGEYVIPSHVVRAKGTDFFDKLVQTYTQPRE